MLTQGILSPCIEVEVCLLSASLNLAVVGNRKTGMAST